ncbi:GspH/FimT family pseudopilin [Thauera sp.]|uniref:GspH/FimT family pseudopilin n=1 Tax=Thauera sp. TaxID=1905334 RepID=UPI002B5084CB|nr:GspH/FimT family pseudopilin [Thauera sp.]HRP24569.1 GspH/FimT family pseudopilin [Thauera sp.]
MVDRTLMSAKSILGNGPRSERRSGPRGVRGITLIEAMVVVAIIAILAGIAAPSFQGMMANSRLNTAANDVFSGLHLAKSEAIRQNTSIRFCVNSTSRAWMVENTAGTDIRVGQLNATVGLVFAGVDTTTVAGHGCVRFRPDGVSYGSGGGLISAGSITLNLGGSTRVINIRTGAIHAG